MKKYNQNKLSSILAQIAKETRELIAKYAFWLVFIATPILMDGQTADTVYCITGIRLDGVRVAVHQGNEYVVKYSSDGKSYIVVGTKSVFIKTRKRNDKITK